jgi:phosphoribosylglycinamide formyltransferase-1
MTGRLGILISGRGSNFAAIADSIADGRLDAEIAVVISNRPEAEGLRLAAERGIRAAALPSHGLDREIYDRRLIAELCAARVDLVCLAGYMRILSGHFIRQFSGRILNIHPSLLPAFPGLDAPHQAIRHGVKFSGCTVHFVDEGVDSGPILKQAVVPVLGGDTAESLAARILKEEHRTYIEAIALALSGRYRIEGRLVVEF